MSTQALLAQHPVFHDWSPQELDALVAIAERRSYAPGDAVFSGDADSLFVVERGSLLLQLSNRETHLLRAGALFGEVGLINPQMRLGNSVRAQEETVCLVFPKVACLDPQRLPCPLALKLVLGLAAQVTNYLRTRSNTATRALMEQGEHEFVEFKSTLRHNLHTGKHDRAMEHAVLKSMAAFMNTKGGTLLVGVSDAGVATGLLPDGFKSDDQMLLHLGKLLHSAISGAHSSFVQAVPETIDGQSVLRIDCEPASLPAFLRDGNREYFYVRSGPATIDLKVSEAYAYIRDRFEGA